MSELSLLLLLLTTLLLALMVMRWVSDRFDQPRVLGDLLLGVLVGNFGVWIEEPLFAIVMNPESSDALKESSPIAANVATVFAALAELGAVFLLFSAGLETSVAKMKRVGGRALMVAFVGVVAPFVFAYTTCVILHVKMDVAGHLFLAATLSATSVGITASVLKDMRALDQPESEVILGAAVIDDVLGLVLLAIVSRIAINGNVDPWLLGQTVGTAALFVGAVILCGESIAGFGSHLFSSLDRTSGRLLFAVAFAFGMAWFAQIVGLAAIVGAFAAGLVLRDNLSVADVNTKTVRPVGALSATIAPVEKLLSPLFFLYVGMQVDVSFFLSASTLILALVFCICAVIGKLVAGWPAGPELDRLSIGIGMIPRGEVGLVFLGTGRSLGVVSDALFAALVIVVFVSTVLAPPALKWSLRRNQKATPANQPQ